MLIQWTLCLVDSPFPPKIRRNQALDVVLPARGTFPRSCCIEWTLPEMLVVKQDELGKQTRNGDISKKRGQVAQLSVGK